MTSSDPFQQVVDEAAKKTADISTDQQNDVPAPPQTPPEPPVTAPSNIQVISVEPEPAPAPTNPAPTPTDANSLNSLIDALMDSSKPQAPPQGTNIIVGSPSAPPPPAPIIPGAPPPDTPPQGKKKSKTGLIIATILILLITLPIGIYFISQQRQLTEQRSKAALPNCSQGGGACRSTCKTTEYFEPEFGCSGTYKCCMPNAAPTTKIPTSTLAMPPTITGTAKVDEWGNCNNDSDCKTGLFCGATAKCVKSTAKCPNGALAPDGDPCSCSILKSDGTPNRDIRCGCVSGTKIECWNRSQVTGYTLKQCKGTQTCQSNGNYAACVNDTPLNCTGGEPIGATATKPATGCTFPPPNGVRCRGTGETFANTSGIFNGICAFYHCPNGCVNGKCGEDSPGFWLEFGPCTSTKLQTNECGQIDTVNQNNSYCIPESGCDSRIQCPTNCTLNITQPPSPSKTPTATATSTSAPTATETSQPTATGTTAPTATSTSAPTATETSQPTATTTTIASCNQSCGADSDCDSGLVCYTGMCRKPECLDETDCSCPLAQEETPTPETPVTGVPSIAGIASALGGIILIIIGLLL